jgi:hypothetical protein
MKYNKPLRDSMECWCQPADNTALYRKVATGDEKARKRMIVDNMPMVVSIVDKYLSVNEDCDYLRDDLMSEGFLALTGVVDALRTTHLTHERAVTSYLFTAIRNAARKAACHSAHQPAGKDCSKRTMSCCSSNEEVDAADLIKACCRTPLERELVRLRQKGYSLRVIANKLRTNYSAVQTGYTAIQDRYNEKALSA